MEADTKGKPKDAPNEGYKDNKPIYLKKWMRTKRAIMFRLSNKVVQVNFEDKTEVILDSETHEVCYRNKKGVISIYPLSTAMSSKDEEMTKRLKYTKDILTHMVINKKATFDAGTSYLLFLERTFGGKDIDKKLELNPL